MLAKMAGLICAVLFAAIIKTSYPTTRAVAMAVIVITALIFARRTALLDALALSGCFILLIWPLSLFTPGFLLSFAAVLGLVMVLERMRDAQVWKQILAVPIVAAAFTMPMAVYIFGFVAPLGIIFNVIFVPLFSFLALPLGLLGLLSASISDAASLALFAWAMNLISLIVWTGEHFGRLVPVPRPNVVWVYLIYLGLIISFLGSLRQSDNAMEMHIRRLLLWCICLALIIMPVGQHYYQHSRPLMFDFISVGQGDSILITKGSHAVLIDAGGTRKGFDTGRFVVGPHLLRRGITRLDLAVLTHSHPDHAGGMPFILERFDADQVWTNIVNDRGFDDVTRITSLKSIPVLAVQRGERLLLDDIKIEVLHPQVRHVKSSELDLNLHSVVLMIGDAHMSGLFMADAHRFGEMTVIHGDTEMRADVLKVAHHGSAGSCQNIFLDNVKARLAVIMCGYHNYYGMPDPDVLERLQVRGVDIYRTDRNGEVQIISNHARIGVKSILCPAEKQ
jgi:competence protein ComEC